MLLKKHFVDILYYQNESEFTTDLKRNSLVFNTTTITCFSNYLQIFNWIEIQTQYHSFSAKDH